ncbi:hypothetical protein FB451DRAFT_1169635 [Mycena latifolia]|nr:hypothetical protein FB451DRAFT_1169635 [Mycena latifolia]
MRPVLAPNTPDHSSDKENHSSPTSTRSGCSLRSITRPTSRHHPLSAYISSHDAELAYKLRSEHYERQFRNERHKGNRAAAKSQDLQKRLNDLSSELSNLQGSSTAFGTALQQRLTETQAELAVTQKNLEKSNARNTDLTRSHAALTKRVSRIPGRIESGAAKLASQSLKQHGVISSEMRTCVRDLVAIGVPLESVSKMIHAIAKGLNIQIKDAISTRSAGRIVLEGGVAATLQIVDEIKNTDNFTLSGDGTSHLNLNYESRMVAIDGKLLAVGLMQAPNHTSEEQLRGWQTIVDEMYEIYNARLLGKTDPQDARTFYTQLTGMMTDHANDQKKLRALFFALKQQMEREVRGERALSRLTSPELLKLIYELTEEKIRAAGGMAAWDALPAEERVAQNMNLRAELCQKYGQQEFDVLPQEEKDEADFFLGGGCCMHKDLNAHKGGVESMAASWLKNGFEQPVLFMNKDNDAAAASGSTAAKARAEKVSARGAVKLTELMGMLLNNKDDKRGMQDGHGIFFNAHEHIGHPVMRVVRSSTGGLRNLWDMGPVLRMVIEHCRQVIADPDLICGPNLSHKTASMDGQLWDRPEAMYAAHALLLTLPMNEVRAALVAFLEGAVTVWERFSTDVLSAELTDAQKRKAWMPATNDANEGWLKSNARSEADKEKVSAHRTKQKQDWEKRIAELKHINSCPVIFDISRFQDVDSIRKIKGPEMDLQIRWHRLRELETDKKTEVPAPYKLKNKTEKAAVLVAALERWLLRVQAGEFLLRGLQVIEPEIPEEAPIESDNEEEEVGYGEQD